MCAPKTYIRYQDDTAQALEIRCKQWQCSDCRPRLMRRLRGIAISGAPTSFLTLTVNPHIGNSPGERARTAIKGWQRLRRIICREYKLKSLPFMYVVEATARGEPHLHVLVRAPYIAQAWLSAQWERLTGAKIVDIRRVTTARGAAYYVSKYLSEAPEQFHGCRRFNRSRSYSLVPARERAKIDWQQIEFREVKIGFGELLFFWKQAGWRVEAEHCGSALAYREDATGPPPLWEQGKQVESKFF